MTQIITNNSWWGGSTNAVIWPSSAVDWDIVLFDWATWKLIKDSWKALADLQGRWIEVNVATAYNTAAKVWTTTAGNYTPTKWDFLLVNFVKWCSVATPTLNIDWSWAKNIRIWASNVSSTIFDLWSTNNSNVKALMYYDGTYYQVRCTKNTTYSALSLADAKTGTATANRLIQASVLKQAIKYHAVDNTRLSDDRYSKTDIAPSEASIYYEFDKRDIQAGTDLEIVWAWTHNLPDWYTELAYLWGSGSWYIDTWKILNCRDSIKIKFKRAVNTYSSVMSWFGSIQGSSSIPRYWIWVRTSWDFFTWANSTTDIAQTDMNIHTLEMWYDNGYFYKWDWWAKTTYTPDSETNPTANAYLFARNWSSITYSWWVRIYYLEWKRNDWTDVAHLIPAQRDSDWVLGMYDLVSNTFLAPSGSGTWAWSPLGNVINFTNDSGYITDSELPTKAQLLITSLSSWDATADIDEWHLTSGTLVTITLDDAFTWALNNIDIDWMNTIAVMPRGIAIRDWMMGIFTVSSENWEELYIIPNSDDVDLSWYQTTANLVTDLTNPDNTHYPSAKAVADAITSSGGWDMLKSVYDPNSVEANAFDYCNFINTPTIPSVVNSLCCTSTTDALSANQWKELKDLIDTYVGLWRFLSLWDASTGQPVSFPLTTPYTYKTWDWYMVEVVWATNYMPNWSSYTWAASTTVDSTNNVEVRDVYIYDGTDWLFQKNNEVQVSFSDIAWVPNDNACLCSALAAKADDSAVVKLSWNQTVCWTKTFCTSPVVPSKTAAVTNTWTAIATEAQVYCVKQSIPTDNCQLANSCCYATVSQLPTVNNATLTIQKNWVDVKTFTANASSNVTANITVPTDNCQLGNGCWYTTCTWTLTASSISDTAFAASWDWDTTHAPSKNAIYDVLWDVETLLANL